MDFEKKSTVINFNRDNCGKVIAIGDAGIKEEESLLHFVKNKDKKAIKKWEDKAEKGETLRIM